MKKINNKGYMLVEVIVSSVVAFVMVYFLMDITIKMVNKNNDYYLESVLLADKSLITKEIMDDINSKTLTEVNASSDNITFTFSDGTYKTLTISNGLVTYGDYQKKLSDDLDFGAIEMKLVGDILKISIPGYTNYSKEDYGISIAIPYDKSIDVTYPVLESYDLIISDILVDGNPSDSMPVTSLYNINPNCTNATATFDYTTKKLLVSNVSVASQATCSPIITQVTRPTLASKIKSLIPSGQTTVASTSFNDGSTLEIINSALDTGATSNDYRYRGVNPNNYIKFNNELWRIIGVFDQYSHGQTGQELVKIIRDDSIGRYLLNKTNINNWEDSDLFALLNTGYYNSVNGTGEDYCYYHYTDYSQVPGKCSFTSKGIKEPYKSMIQNATWYLGGFYGSEKTSADMYNYERHSDASRAENKPIGLMYASDYGYAAPSTCTSYLNRYSDSGCANKDWLKSNREEWLITYYNDSYGFSIYSDGIVVGSAVYQSGSTRPVLYLKSNVYYISGDGSQINPYIISM